VIEAGPLAKTLLKSAGFCGFSRELTLSRQFLKQVSFTERSCPSMRLCVNHSQPLSRAYVQEVIVEAIRLASQMFRLAPMDEYTSSELAG
jgi:hypothetical protein